MISFSSKSDNDTPDEELGGALRAAVEATAHRHADEATVRRVIERASQFAPAPPQDSVKLEPTSLPQPRASISRKRMALMASWGGVTVAAVCLAVGLMLTSQDRLAFAQVQEQLAKVRTIRFVFQSMDPANQQLGRVFVVEPYRYREERPDGRVIVADLRNKQVMELDTKAKTGEVYLHYGDADRKRRFSEAISTLRNAPRKSVETIGRRQLDGREMVDYRVVNDDGMTFKVTVDVAEKLPVRVEWSGAGNANAAGIATNFVFDRPIDEALFEIAAPDGYKMTVIESKVRPDADALVLSSAGLGPVKWGMKTVEIVELLGQPDGIKQFETPIGQFSEGKTKQIGTNTGEELIYDSRGFRIIVDAESGVEHIYCYGAGQLGDRGRAFNGRTDKGIRMGATPDEVAEAYGEPELRHGVTVDLPSGRWDYLTDGLAFNFFDNVVSQFQVRCPQLRPNELGIIAIPIRK